VVLWVAMGLALWQLLMFAASIFLQVPAGTWNPFAFLQLPQGNDGRSRLVSHNARDVIEMSFWLLSFLEKFEKEFESSQQRIAQESGEAGQVEGKRIRPGLFGHNARRLIKLMRYVSKFLSTFDSYRKHQRDR